MGNLTLTALLYLSTKRVHGTPNPWTNCCAGNYCDPNCVCTHTHTHVTHTHTHTHAHTYTDTDTHRHRHRHTIGSHIPGSRTHDSHKPLRFHARRATGSMPWLGYNIRDKSLHPEIDTSETCHGLATTSGRTYCTQTSTRQKLAMAWLQH